jgi:beta-mannanase
MNTPWFSYGRDPGNYKLAFVRIRQIFTQNGVPASAVRWVFAPTNQVQLTFESYYPGDDLVDIVGVSAYNDGFCPSTLDPFWDSPQEAFGFALQELHAMAPDKPIFITRLGTTAYTAKKQTNNTAKDQWLRDAYSYVATDPSVRAILYDNYNGSCDWPVFAPGEFQFDGYRDAVADLHYGYLTPARLGETNLDPVIGDKEYYFPFTIATNHQPVLLGTYSQEWIGSQRVMDYEYHALDTWAGKRLSIAGMFLDMFSSPVDNVEMPIEAAWDNGYTPFVNLTVQSNSGITAAKIANGYADAALHDIARTYATMAQYNHQMAFFAPLQEMNGDWVPYSKDPENFKLAYRRIQQIFAEEGVPSNSIKWVFAPSGWSAPESPAFEDYYPGDAYVDVIGFSAYNFGYCPVSQYPKWESPKAIYYKYIERITVLAPGKPIFIAQTGTSAYTSHGKDVAMKNQWLSDAYDYLAAHPSVRAVLYYNRYDDECDFSFYQLGGEQYTGYQQGVANPVYDYISPYALRGMIFAWP